MKNLHRPAQTPEDHPVMAAVLEATAKVSGNSIAADMRLALRYHQASLKVCGLLVPAIPAFGSKEGLAILTELAHNLNQTCFYGVAHLADLLWSERLSRTAGRAFVRQRRVELSWPLYCEAGIFATGAIVAHELIHVWLHAVKRPHGHTTEFIQKSKALGLPEIRHHLDLKLECYRAFRLAN